MTCSAEPHYLKNGATMTPTVPAYATASCTVLRKTILYLHTRTSHLPPHVFKLKVP
jgi:hypothetical protein